ncbi:MAG: hypothetical protein R3D85_05295 [Paracoccaceae bacterium]
MPWRDRFYSRLVAWLKVLLPLAALALLSTLFLFSRNIDPVTTTFTKIDPANGARDERITAPRFAGASDEGHLIAFRAASAHPDPNDGSRASADRLTARIDLTSGTVITFAAEGGSVDQGAGRAVLDGDVVVTSSTGYVVHTDRLISGLHEIAAESPGPISGNGPPGHFTAGAMQLTAQQTDPPQKTPPIHLLFTGGVKLLYDPKETKD